MYKLHFDVVPGWVGEGKLLEVDVEVSTAVVDWPGRGPVHSTQYDDPDLRAEHSLTLRL